MLRFWPGCDRRVRRAYADYSGDRPGSEVCSGPSSPQGTRKRRRQGAIHFAASGRHEPGSRTLPQIQKQCLKDTERLIAALYSGTWFDRRTATEQTLAEEPNYQIDHVRFKQVHATGRQGDKDRAYADYHNGLLDGPRTKNLAAYLGPCLRRSSTTRHMKATIIQSSTLTEYESGPDQKCLPFSQPNGPGYAAFSQRSL